MPATDAPLTEAPAPTRPRDPEPGSPLALALYEIYTGKPVVMVDSPPGAGKSTLVARAVSHLFDATDATIVVAVFTNDQGADLSERIAAELGPDHEGVPRVRAGSANIPEAEGVLRPGDFPDRRCVTVRTVASCKASPPRCDVLVVDEAYQTTFADFADAADFADQVLVVGDPGQIGPVIAFSSDAWDRMKRAPHMRCPEVLLQREDVTRLTLPATYRLGPQTTRVIAPLYDFAFDSRRPLRRLEGLDGEIAVVNVPVREKEYDLDTIGTVVAAASSYVGRTVIETGPNGVETSRALTERDVAIVVSRNAQVSAVEALLLAAGFSVGDFTVGSADRLQGGQWHAVVAVDPALAGAGSGHALSSGRLCVMLSRHMTHLTWVYDDSWSETLAEYEDTTDAAKGTAVRTLLAELA